MEKILSNTYALGALLGSGGMGAVYEGRHIRTQQRVAVKVIARVDRHDEQSLHRFQREAKAVALLKTPHIVSVLDTGFDEELGPFTVMEFLEGRDLDHLVDELGPLPPTLALKISAQVALGLKAAHAANIVHRDIKPANVFLESTDSDLVVCRVLDFGIAKIVDRGDLADTGLTNSGSMMGSPRYMSPEQARRAKHADHRADIWSLGVTIYKALSGVTPTDHLESMADLIISLCQEPPRPLQSVAPWIEPEVASLVHACLALEPSARLPSVDAWLDRVRDLLPSGFEIHARDLVPLPADVRGRIADRVAVPGYSTSGTAAVRTGDDALAATEQVGRADVVTRVEGRKTPASSGAKTPAASASDARATGAPSKSLEDSSAARPTSHAVAPSPPRRVWTFAALGVLTSLAAGAGGVWIASSGAHPAAADRASAPSGTAVAIPTDTARGGLESTPHPADTQTTAPADTVAPERTAQPGASGAASSAPAPSASATPPGKVASGPPSNPTPSMVTPTPKPSAKVATPSTSTSGEIRGTFE